MRKQVPMLAMSVLLIAALSVNVDAKSHKRAAMTPTEISGPTPFWTWTYRAPVPEGAYVATVSYGPGNQRCVSQLVQLPNRWWRPLIKCE